MLIWQYLLGEGTTHLKKIYASRSAAEALSSAWVYDVRDEGGLLSLHEESTAIMQPWPPDAQPLLLPNSRNSSRICKQVSHPAPPVLWSLSPLASWNDDAAMVPRMARMHTNIHTARSIPWHTARIPWHSLRSAQLMMNASVHLQHRATANNELNYHKIQCIVLFTN